MDSQNHARAIIYLVCLSLFWLGGLELSKGVCYHLKYRDLRPAVSAETVDLLASASQKANLVEIPIVGGVNILLGVLLVFYLCRERRTNNARADLRKKVPGSK